MLKIFQRKRFTPQDLADQAQRILSEQCRKWDVDDYEHYHSKDPTLEDMHIETLRFGLPEEWIKLEEESKRRLQATIDQMRKVETKD
ncbi:MAG: hypothetical protein WB729_20630 [Candidatus Sulfotelmatobacter sp.]